MRDRGPSTNHNTMNILVFQQHGLEVESCGMPVDRRGVESNGYMIVEGIFFVFLYPVLLRSKQGFGEK